LDLFGPKLRETAIAFGDVGGDGEGRAVELVGEEVLTAWEVLGEGADGVREVYGLLVDLEFFKGEGHVGSLTERE
jgi:hypothetical protein